MEQAKLFDERVPKRKPRAARTDDVCAGKHGGNRESVAANQVASRSKQTLRNEIYTHLRLWQKSGMTCREIALFLGKPMHAISGRLSELKQMGLVVATGTVREHGRVVVADVNARAA